MCAISYVMYIIIAIYIQSHDNSLLQCENVNANWKLGQYVNVIEASSGDL